MQAGKTLSKLLTSPSKVAQALDWRKVSGSLLSLNISRDRIDLAVASHPSSGDASQSLPSIPVKTEIVNNERVLSPAVAQELSKIIKDWQICGVVVSWPTQKEGWCGAACGRVLFTLDQLIANNVLPSSKPVCLWDDEHNLPFEDEWGRSPVYAQASDKIVHKASEEQYPAPDTVAADIWNDFCRAHWPELYYNCQATAPAWTGKKLSSEKPRPVTTVNLEWLDSLEDTAAYTKAAL